jgi:phosphohistidine phosphatase
MRLFLLRHARAEVGSDREPDALRPLSEAGRRDASSAGTWLARRPGPPTRVLCSSARRTVETMERVVAQLPVAPDVHVLEELYLASAWKLFELARETPEGTGSLLCVGHNPGIAELALRLAGHGDPAARMRLASRFLPATLAEIELAAERWADLEPGSGLLVAHFVA